MYLCIHYFCQKRFKDGATNDLNAFQDGGGKYLFMDDVMVMGKSSLQTTLRAELAKDEVDRVIEDELTVKLAGDLLQSIERKFQVDLEK